MKPNVAVLGAGQMGGGIAHVAALAGCCVDIYDSRAAAVEGALSSIAANMARQVRSGAVDEAARAAALERITARAEVGEWLRSAEFVIEAVTEEAAVKGRLYAEVAPFMGARAILATNTSSYSITELAAMMPDRQVKEPSMPAPTEAKQAQTRAAAGKADYPPAAMADRFAGMHFMNPVPMMPLVEVIVGARTSAETYTRTVVLAELMGKETVRAEDYPGFIANRILMPMLNEAVFALWEGVGGVLDIDRAMVLGMRHPMGPLTLADFIGLDTCLAVMGVLHEGFGDAKFRACPLLKKLVAAGHYGRKSGVGFYDYRGDAIVVAQMFRRG